MLTENAVLARIVASWNGWNAPGFPDHAEKGEVYLKEFNFERKVKVGVFVIGEGTTYIPLKELLDTNAFPNLDFVLSLDAVNLRTLSMIGLVEDGRKENLAIHSETDEPLQGLFSIEIVGESGKDETGHTQYGIASFDSTLEVVTRIVDLLKSCYLKGSNSVSLTDGASFAPNDFRPLLPQLFKKLHVAFQVDGDTVVKIEKPR